MAPTLIVRTYGQVTLVRSFPSWEFSGWIPFSFWVFNFLALSQIMLFCVSILTILPQYGVYCRLLCSFCGGLMALKLARFPDDYPGIFLDRLRAFIDEDVVNAVLLVGVGKGFAIQVRLPSGIMWLHSEKSGRRRIFARAETAFKLLKILGVGAVKGVDLSSWEPAKPISDSNTDKD